VDPAFGLRPVNYPGYTLLNVASNPTGDHPTKPSACSLGKGNGGEIACSLTLDPAAVPRNCTFNPCSGGLCDGLHRLMLRTDSLVSPSHPMFVSLPPDGQVGAGTLSTVTIVPFTTKNSVAPSVCTSSLSAASSAPLVVADGGGFDSATVEAARMQADAQLAASVAGLPPDTLSAPQAARAAGMPTGAVDAANGLFRAEAAGTPPVELLEAGVQLSIRPDDEL
jgi:hypothetical protein